MSDTERRDEQALPRDAQALPRSAEHQEKVTAAEWICPAFAFSRVFSSHMVLQRDKTICVWGFSTNHGSVVEGILGQEQTTAVVDEPGKWTLTFPPRSASFEGVTLTATDGIHTAVIDDILIGDVWLIGGQSNAELNLSRCMEETPDLVFSGTNGVRLFNQRSYVARQKPECWTVPQPDIVCDDAVWQTASREASLSHSALGWYFAHELIKHVSVPQGLIMMCSGGASIFDLAPAEYAHERGVFEGGMTCEGGLYNTIIHPFEGLSFAGQVFFQGESEGCSLIRSRDYCNLLAAFVAEQRKRFGFDFPFYNVQLSSYRDDGAAFFKHLHVVRMKQFEALSVVPNSTLTPDFDLGALPKYEDWAHSTLKSELGRRVATVVLAEYYGVGALDTAHAPMPELVTFSDEGYKIVFRGAGEGLLTYGHTVEESIDTEVRGFFLYDGETYTPTTARLVAFDTVIADVVAGVHPTHVAYAFIPTVTPENANLYRHDMVPPCAFTVEIK